MVIGSDWEHRGRGISVFNASKQIVWPFTTGKTAIIEPKESVYYQHADRIVIPYVTANALQDRECLDWLINDIFLPAYRNRIPCYVTFESNPNELNMKSMVVRNREDLNDAADQLMREQIGSIIQRMCVVVTNPDRIPQELKCGMTPPAIQLANSLDKAKLPYRVGEIIGQRHVNFIIPLSDQNVLAIDTDGREFMDQSMKLIKDELLSVPSVVDVIHFHPGQIFFQPDRCVELIRRQISLHTREQPLTTIHDNHFEPELSPEQEACLQPRHGAVLTLAPAGSGKTRILTRRVSEYIKNGMEENRILCVVFNKDAREVMTSRIHRQMGFKNITIQNIHQTGCALVQGSPQSPFHRFEIIDTGNPEYRKLLRKIIIGHKKEMDGTEPYVNHAQLEEYIEYIEQYKRTLAIPGSIDCLGLNEIDRFLIIQKIDEMLFKEKKMTYDDQILRSVQLLCENPQLRSQYWNRFDAVLTDEFQDLTPMQFSLVRLMAMPLNNIFAVGDDDQMIYSFLSADPRNIRDFNTLFRGSVIHTLGENWRSDPGIVSVSANLISYNRMRHEKPIRAAGISGKTLSDSVKIAEHEETQSEVATVIKALQKWHEDGFAYKEMAVLVRVSNLTSLLQPALDEAKVPYRVIGGSPFYTSGYGLLIGSYLTLISTPRTARSDQIELCLKTPNKYLNHDTCRKLAHLGWERITQEFTRLTRWQQEKLQQFIMDVENLQKEILSQSSRTSDLFGRMLETFRIDAHYEEEDTGIATTGTVTGREFIRLIEEQSRHFDTFLGFVSDYFLRLEREEKSRRSKTNHSGDEVQIKTIHKSKGEEYPCVVIFHADDGIIPHQRAIETGSSDAEEEERRVFYVAVTRAIKQLLITAGAHPSRFIEELQISRQDRDMMRSKSVSSLFKKSFLVTSSQSLLYRVLAFLKGIFGTF